VLSAVEYVYAIVCALAAVPLLLALGPVAHAANQTSVRLLGGALLAFAVGALAVARDPVRNRALLQAELVFTGVATLSLLWRLVSDGSQARTWVLLLGVGAALVLLAALYPASRE